MKMYRSSALDPARAKAATAEGRGSLFDLIPRVLETANCEARQPPDRPEMGDLVGCLRGQQVQLRRRGASPFLLWRAYNHRR